LKEPEGYQVDDHQQLN